MTLAGTVVAAGYWAVDVYHQQPPLPDLSRPDSATTATDLKGNDPSPRRKRPDVFYAALLERPLFAPGRRPVVAEPEIEVVAQQEVREPTPEPTKAPAPDLGLLGVMGTDNTNSALVANAGGDPIWITTGTTIAGWTVTNIGTDWLELNLDDETIRIEMYQK
ncbi:hypothetical protein ABMC88_16910 [Sulfitobacter sp. HNIBRBA2951]|uniref:hypothetical protein n=1 Tax=Sulfitobacter aquimarinus TaxID=3158557 RepID=UPI0032E034CD